MFEVIKALAMGVVLYASARTFRWSADGLLEFLGHDAREPEQAPRRPTQAAAPEPTRNPGVKRSPVRLPNVVLSSIVLTVAACASVFVGSSGMLGIVSFCTLIAMGALCVHSLVLLGRWCFR